MIFCSFNICNISDLLPMDDIHIWNIYETGDPECTGPDPFDIFIYAIRREDEPHMNDTLYVEGRQCKVIALMSDVMKNEMLASPGEKYWKVCVK